MASRTEVHTVSLTRFSPAWQQQSLHQYWIELPQSDEKRATLLSQHATGLFMGRTGTSRARIRVQMTQHALLPSSQLKLSKDVAARLPECKTTGLCSAKTEPWTGGC